MKTKISKTVATLLLLILPLGPCTFKISSVISQSYTPPTQASQSISLLWIYNTLGGVRAVFLTEDGRYATAGGLGFITRLDAETGREVWNLEKPYQVDCMASTDDGSLTVVGLEQARLLTIGGDGSVQWKLTTEGPVLSLALTSGGSKAVFGTFFGTLYFAYPLSREVSSLHRRKGSTILGVVMSDDGTKVAAGYSDDSVVAFKWDTPEPLWHIKIEGHAKALKYSPDGDTLLVGSSSGLLYALNTGNGVSLWTFKANGSISSITFVEGSSRVAVGSHDGSVYLICMDDGSKLDAYESEGAVRSIAYIENGSILYLGGTDRRFRALNMSTSEELGSVKAGFLVKSISPSGDGSKVVFGAGKAVYCVGLPYKEWEVQYEAEGEDGFSFYTPLLLGVLSAAIGLGAYVTVKRLLARSHEKS